MSYTPTGPFATIHAGDEIINLWTGDQLTAVCDHFDAIGREYTLILF